MTYWNWNLLFQLTRVACYCSAQLIKRVKKRMTTVVFSAILNPVAWFRRELKDENFDIVGKTNADEVEDLDEVEITEIEIRCDNCGKMIILNMN